MLFQELKGAHAEVSGAIRACSSAQLRSHMQALTAPGPGNRCSDSTSAARGGCNALGLRVFCGRTVSAAGVPGRAAAPAA